MPGARDTARAAEEVDDMRKMQVLRGVVPLFGVMVVMAGLARSPRAAQVFGDWSAPMNPGPPLNTSSNDNYAVLSKDQLTIYFTSNRPGGLGGDDLWFGTRESIDAPWEEQNIHNMGELINSSATDSLPFLSPNEHVLYFYSTRPGPCGATATGLGDIWMTRRRNKHSDWEQPTNLGCDLNTSADEIAPAFFKDPESGQAWLFYGSNRVVPGVSIGDYDVYASPLGAHGLAGPGILIPEFSSPGRDTRIFIRKDGLEAFITSNRAGGQGGIDIWTSTRATLSDPWPPAPTNLGFPVNSTADDGSPWLSKDGTTLYFFSTRPGGSGGRDIWYTTRVKLND
jgi:WD40-like Beta Propeller Repeat